MSDVIVAFVLASTVMLRINARGVYLIFGQKGGAFIRGGRLKEGGVYKIFAEIKEKML